MLRARETLYGKHFAPRVTTLSGRQIGFYRYNKARIEQKPCVPDVEESEGDGEAKITRSRSVEEPAKRISQTPRTTFRARWGIQNRRGAKSGKKT